MAKPGPQPRPVIDRLLDLIVVHPDDGCWEWTAKTNGYGYGYMKVGSRSDGTYRDVGVHIVSYEHFVGPVPEGFTVDHLCHNVDEFCVGGASCSHRRCANPVHLEAVPGGVNTARGQAGIARGEQQRAKTHCPEGHEYDDANTYVDRRGGRHCRACSRAASARWRARNR